MKTPPRALLSASGLLLTAALLSACGGGSHNSAIPSVPGGATPSVAVTTGTFTFTIPKASSNAKAHRMYVSSATKSISLQVTDVKNHGTSTDIYANVPAALKAVQTINFANLTGNPTTPGQCGTDPSNAGNYKCTATFQLPVGDDTLTMTAWDANGGTGNALSQQISTLTATQGAANTYAVTLDANAANMTVTAASGFCASSFTVSNNQTIGTVGTTGITFAVSFTDLAGKTIVAPGLPKLSVGGVTSSGTVGNLDITVNQSAQTFTLRPHNGTGDSGTVTLTATSANTTGSSDGLSFSKTLTVTLTAGSGLPSSLLAIAEQSISGTGVVTGSKIEFYTVALGASDTITAYSTSSLTAQPAPGPANSDVDFTNDLTWDSNGDLMVANGGSGSPDFGNYSCVPQGAISTGANAATILTSNLDDPTRIVLGTDSSVSLINGTNSGGHNYDSVEFTLSGQYAAASSSRDIVLGASGWSAVDEVALPTSASNPAGSYAVSLYNGTSRASEVLIIHPDGSTVTLTNATLSEPHLAYDSYNNQLVVVSDGRSLATPDYTKSNISFWTVSGTPTLVKTIYLEETQNAGAGPYSSSTAVPLGPVAASADGHIAVIISGASGYPELDVYDGSASRNQVLSTLDYGAADCATGTNFTYGGASAVNVANSLIWLSSSKLMVELYSQVSHSLTSANGVYIYDITSSMSQSNCDNATGAPEGATTVKQTGFRSLTSSPYRAAFKP